MKTEIANLVKEYRCTRPDLYAENTKNEDMQGHYIIADSEWDARMVMAKDYPDDRQCQVKFFRYTFSPIL